MYWYRAPLYPPGYTSGASRATLGTRLNLGTAMLFDLSVAGYSDSRTGPSANGVTSSLSDFCIAQPRKFVRPGNLCDPLGSRGGVKHDAPRLPRRMIGRQ